MDYSTGIVLLAGGASQRMGAPKQLLSYGGMNLLHYMTNIANESGIGPVVLVLGAYADIVGGERSKLPAEIIINDHWSEGMASSIRCGLEFMKAKYIGVEGVIIMVCDQPFVTTSLLQKLVATHLETGKSIVSCAFSDTYGPPVFFHKTFFPQLIQLTGEGGAKKLVLRHPGDLATVQFEQGKIDIDTREDYDQLVKN